jgi:hypothetical protein
MESSTAFGLGLILGLRGVMLMIGPCIVGFSIPHPEPAE